MERGRILILGNSKETTYELRNLLDNHRFELEIALSADVGRSILSERWMNLLIIHTELLDERSARLFEFMADRDIEIPILVVGEERQEVPGSRARRTGMSGSSRSPTRQRKCPSYIQAL